MSPRLSHRCLVFALLALLAAPSAAQLSTSRRTSQQPLRLGGALVFPFWIVEASHNDNLFRNASGVSATVTTVTPGFVAEVPFSNSQIAFGAALRYRDYEGAEIDSKYSQFALTEGRLRFRSGWFCDWDVGYQRGVLDSQLFDPGGEFTFGGERFTSLGTAVAVGHQREAKRRLALTVRRDDVEFDRETGVGFFDADALALAVEGSHQRGRNLWVEWDVQAGETDLFRPLGSGEDRRRQETLEVAGGVRWQISPGSWLRARVGLKHDDFVSAQPGTFTGLAGSVDLARVVPGQVVWTTRVQRTIFPSVYAQNNYYESDQLTTRFDAPAEARLILGAQLSYLLGRYPEPVPRRRDQTVEARAWVGYRFKGVWEWRLNAAKIYRSSTVDPFEFDTTVVGMSFGFGG